ncbi:DUF4013 domain-containing protein [Methanobrevibacter filiformis]|uniref:Glycerophosphoryl diester phosphodiesterase membrane domain-containing protein n=1 Tax=Methanobrevibacter filiformis TaxID=55758 RepID=A0A165Z4X1_9EURY|nr:DUF4013 domain-containing protein [Methanobrevibacter filiformis]KZX10251.1 hypothetical protein MBFIL_18680 [Methanobrevibacter filiformis]
MNIMGNIKEALIYPSKDWNKVVTLGVFFFLLGIISLIDMLVNVASVFNPMILSANVAASFIGTLVGLNPALITGDIVGGVTLFGLICDIITFVIVIFILGFVVDIMRNTIAGIDSNILNFNFTKSFKDGLKVLVVSIIYNIIPAIITFILGYFTVITPMVSYINNHAHDVVSTSIPTLVSYNLFIVGSISYILTIIASIFLIAALARLSETDNIKEVINIKGVFNKIREIGWGNYIVFLIVLGIILIIATAIIAVFAIIPFIGIFIAGLLFCPYLVIFVSRAIGITYRRSL